MRTTTAILAAVAALPLILAGCASQASYIPGTKVVDSRTNREIIDVIENYRLAVERKDAAALVLMASPKYWEDGGTATGKDDYGYKRLREVLTGRFQQSSDLRYSMRYMRVDKKCPPGAEDRVNCRAYVDVLIDASFTVIDARGEEMRRDKRDQNQLVLEWDGDSWKFLSGM